MSEYLLSAPQRALLKYSNHNLINSYDSDSDSDSDIDFR